MLSIEASLFHCKNAKDFCEKRVGVALMMLDVSREDLEHGDDLRLLHGFDHEPLVVG